MKKTNPNAGNRDSNSPKNQSQEKLETTDSKTNRYSFFSFWDRVNVFTGIVDLFK